MSSAHPLELALVSEDHLAVSSPLIGLQMVDLTAIDTTSRSLSDRERYQRIARVLVPPSPVPEAFKNLPNQHFGTPITFVGCSSPPPGSMPPRVPLCISVD
jgi:hypothetical protein